MSRTNGNDVELTTQYIDNRGYNTDTELKSVEIGGTDGSSVNRLKVNADGSINVTGGTSGGDGHTILGGTDAEQKDDTYYGDGVTSGIASVALRKWNGADYDRWDGNVGISSTANNVIMEYKSSDSNIIYIGEAANGTATSAASWKVTRLDRTTSLLAVKYADGNLNYDNVWDNRESLTYS